MTMKIEISQEQFNHAIQKIDEIRQSKEEAVLKKAIASFKKNVDELEKELEELEKKRNEEKIIYYRRKREAEQKKRGQALLMSKLEETRKQQQTWKQQLKEWDADHSSSCLLNGGNGISFFMELTGLSDCGSLDEMMMECEKNPLKKQPLKKQQNTVLKELEQSRQEINHLHHQIMLLSKRIDENVITQLEEEEEEKQQLILIQTTILQDLEQCEVCGYDSSEKYERDNKLASNSSTGRRAI